MITLSFDDSEANAKLIRAMMWKIDRGGTHLAASTLAEANAELTKNAVDVLFLDIEMPDVNGITYAQRLSEEYPALNIVFITGHQEFAFPALGVHCSGFLVKPVDEAELREELRHLRFPLREQSRLLTVDCTGGFAVYCKGEPVELESRLQTELFAYLVYRQGIPCTNGELLGVLWDGNPDKQGRLRQLTMGLRKALREIGAEDVLEKRYGELGVKMARLELLGDPEEIGKKFDWV